MDLSDWRAGLIPPLDSIRPFDQPSTMVSIQTAPTGHGGVMRPDETVVMELLSDPAVKAGLGLLILIIVSAAAFFLVARLRDYTNGDWDTTQSSLLNLEEMRLKGDISEEEFRTIKAASHGTDGGDAPPTRPENQPISDRDD